MTGARRQDDCDFCAIASGKQPAEVVCAEVNWLAFFPLSPATRGHTLVVPRSHVADLWQPDFSLGGELMEACVRVGRAIRSAVKPDGMNLISSAGDAAEQSVFHLHLHLVPRWDGDRIGPLWPPNSEEEPGWIPDISGRVRAACRSG